jgi:hypothetical protein
MSQDALRSYEVDYYLAQMEKAASRNSSSIRAGMSIRCG